MPPSVTLGELLPLLYGLSLVTGLGGRQPGSKSLLGGLCIIGADAFYASRDEIDALGFTVCRKGVLIGP